ncbi:MAG: N-acetyl-gamma-glutamyl-phosphate reductase [Myxococcales bacterium]|nr:N-acetyl-gamma-glutamyl-phosphate reductase [Myxococcales bacterium]
MQRTRVAVLGAGGYAGALLCRLLARHEGVELCLLGSARLRAEGVGALGDPLLGQLPVCGEQEAPARCQALGVQVVVCATPVEASLDLVPQLLRSGARVLDLSGAFRLRDAERFRQAYGLVHPAPDLLAEAIYVLPEVTGTQGVRAARLVANPGCYVTAALLALAPLGRRGLLRPGAPVFIDGKSGASGAGRQATLELSLVELEGEVRPYRIGRHQHAPEIAGVLEELVGQPVPLSFVPQVCGTRRGLLVTCHGQLRDGVSAGEAGSALEQDYAGRARIHLVPAGEVTLRRPVGTPDAWVGLEVLAGGLFCAVCSLDNLLKGAASQAVQNLNAMIGLPDGTGLDSIWSTVA